MAWVAGEVVVLVVLIGLITWLSYAIQDKRRRIVSLQVQVDQQLAGAGETAALKTVLEERRAELGAVRAYIPPEDAIGELVAALEDEAKRRGLTLQIPVVEEATTEANENAAAGEAGSLKEVRFTIVVTGPPRPVLQFFHAVEHLPYLVHVGEWEFSAEEGSVVPGVQVAAPPDGPAGVTAGTPLLEQAAATELTLDLYLAVQRAEGT
jgi:hypothetical protein